MLFLFCVKQQTSGLLLPMPEGKRLSHVPVSAAPLDRAAAAAATILRLRLDTLLNSAQHCSTQHLRLRLNTLLNSAQLFSTLLYSTLAALGSSQH